MLIPSFGAGATSCRASCERTESSSGDLIHGGHRDDRPGRELHLLHF